MIDLFVELSLMFTKVLVLFTKGLFCPQFLLLCLSFCFFFSVVFKMLVFVVLYRDLFLPLLRRFPGGFFLEFFCGILLTAENVRTKGSQTEQWMDEGWRSPILFFTKIQSIFFFFSNKTSVKQNIHKCSNSKKNYTYLQTRQNKFVFYL